MFDVQNIYGTPQITRKQQQQSLRPRRMTLIDLRNVRLEEDDARFRRTASGTIKFEGSGGQFSSKHGIVPIFDRSESLEGKKTGSNMKIQHTSLSDGSTRFPKLEECAHFHYDFVELGQLQLQLCEEDQENYHHRGNEEGELQFMLRVMSKDKTWNIRRSYDNFCMLDKQLHKCIFDRRFSHLPELVSQTDVSNITETEMQELLQKYLKRFSSIAGSMIYCGSILNWLEMDNRGNRLLAVDDSGINTPAIAAAHAIRRYNAQAADEISLEVGDIVSVIDKPPPEDTIWWRGKRGFEVGFFPSECVEVIRDKVPQSMASRIPPPIRKPSSGPVKRWNEGAASSTTTASSTATSSSTNTVLRKHSNFISFLQRFFFTRPARNQLKRSGIVKERVFGCDLGEHLLNSGHDVPLVLKCCAEVIEKQGIIDGIYRLSGINSNIQKLRLAFDEDRMPTLTDETYLQDIHSISSLLKMYFRELPNPLLTYQLYDKFAKAVQAEDKLHLIHDVVQQLPPPHYRTTEYLIRHLARVAAFGTETGMHSKNLAIVWAPNLLRSKELELGGGVAALQGVSIQAVVTEFLICYADLIFSDKMPSYSSPELRQSQKKPRPKSLAISTPTRLLTLEEARERVLSSHNVPNQKYIDVGGGPDKLPPKYHTVLDLPGYKKKSRDAGSMTTLNKPKKSPVSGWKSFFSKSRTSSVKQKVRKSSLQGSLYDTDGVSSVCPSKAITEEDVHNWKKRRLRCAKSAESLLSLSSHKNSVSSSTSNPRGFTDSGMVVNLYTGEDRNRIWQHKRSLSSDASTGLRHHDLLPFYHNSNKEATSTASAIDFRTLPQHDANNDDSASSSSNDSDAEKEPIQLRDIHADIRQSFIRGDSTRRAVTYRKTLSAPSTPQQQTRQLVSEKSKTQEELGNESDSDNSIDDMFEDNQDLYQMKIVKSAEFSQPFDLDTFQLMSKSDGFLVASSTADNDTRRNLTEQSMNKSLMAPSFIQWKDGQTESSQHSGHVLNTGQRQAYYSRFHDYAEIDESQISAPESVVERTKEYALKKQEKEEKDLDSGSKSEKKHDQAEEVPVSKDSSPESTTQLRSDLLSAIAKLEDSISPISYMQKDMSKCLSVPSDIGKSLENVNFGSQSDLMSGVSISELSQSVDSISVNDSTDFNLSCTFAANPSLCPDSATAIDLCKQINKAFSNPNKTTRDSPEKGIRKSTSDIPNSVEGDKEPSKMVRFKQGSNSLDERQSSIPPKGEGDQAGFDKKIGQLSHVSQLSSSVSDNCVRRERKSNVAPTKRYSHHIMEHPKPESVNPLFIVESPPSLESLNSFTQMLKFYDPEEVKHMMAESSGYWSRHSHTTSANNQTVSSPTSGTTPFGKTDQLLPLESDTVMGESKEHTPVNSPITVCKSPPVGSSKDLDLSDNSIKGSNSSLQRTLEGNSMEDFSTETLKQLDDTMESDIMVRSLPPESSLTDSLLKPKTLQSVSGSFKDKTQSEINLRCSSRKLSPDAGNNQTDAASDPIHSSETPSVKRWESMEVNPSLDSVLVVSPRSIITAPRHDSESTVPSFDSNKDSCDQLSVKDSSETLISSPHSPISLKNIYGGSRPPQSSIADLDTIMNMSKEELESAEKMILSAGGGDNELEQQQSGTSHQIPLASPEVSGISDQSEQDQSSEERNLNSQTDSQQRHCNDREMSKELGPLKKSSTVPALGQSQKGGMADNKGSENKPLSQPSSPIKSPSHKEGIEKLRRSFIADRKEFVNQNSQSPQKEKEESEVSLSPKDRNVCKGSEKNGDKETVSKETAKTENNKDISEVTKSKDPKTNSKDTAKSGDPRTNNRDTAKSGDSKANNKDTTKSGDPRTNSKDTTKSGDPKANNKDTAKSGDSKSNSKDTSKSVDPRTNSKDTAKSGDSRTNSKDTAKSGDPRTNSKDTAKSGDSRSNSKDTTKSVDSKTNSKDMARSGDLKTNSKDTTKTKDKRLSETNKSGESKAVGKTTAKSSDSKTGTKGDKTVAKEMTKGSDNKTVAKEMTKGSDNKTVAKEMTKGSDNKTVAKEMTKANDSKTVAKEMTKGSDSKTVAKEMTKLNKKETNQKTSSDHRKTTSGGQKEEKNQSLGKEFESLSNPPCQISPPEEDVLIQIRPTLKRSSSPRRKLIEKMKKDTQTPRDVKRPSVTEETISATNMVPAACGRSCRPQHNTTSQQIPQSTAGLNYPCDDDDDVDGDDGDGDDGDDGDDDDDDDDDGDENDDDGGGGGTEYSKARSLDSLLSNLKTKPKTESSSQRNYAFRCNMTSSSSDVLRGQSKTSMGTATSSDLEVIHDPEVIDSVFLDNFTVDVRQRKESRAGKKCATNIAKNVVDSSSNRSSLDESVLQVAAERHTAFEAAKDGCNTQQYNTASLRYPKAKKLQNLKEFFEHEEMKNRPNYNRSGSSPSNSPTCPRYQRQYREAGKKRESSRKDSMSPSRSREREAAKSTNKSSKTDANNHGRSPTPSAHSPTPSAHSPTPSSRSTTPGGRSPTPSGRSPTPSGRKPAALEKWQRAESHERDGKQGWEMGVDYVLCKSPKSKSEHSTSCTTPKGTAYRMRTGSESSTSDVDVKSPPPQRARDKQRKAVRSAEQSKSDTSDSESKHSFSEMESIGEEQVPRRKRKDSIKELRNYFEGKQTTTTELSAVSSGNNSGSGSNITPNTSVFTASCSELSSHSASTEKTDPMCYMSKSLTCEPTGVVVPRRAARSRVKSLSPVCGQSDLKSDDELSHKGSSRFSLDFSGYTTRPHVEGIVRPQPVRLGPKPFYGAKT